MREGGQAQPLLHKMDLIKFTEKFMNILLEGNICEGEVIKKQYANSKLANFSYTGVGFYVDFIVDKDVQNTNEKDFDDGLSFNLNNQNVDYLIMLFVRNGKISHIEGVGFGDFDFPQEINSFKILKNEK
jgi:hypothetical protein